jgi:hypothetical protein
MGAVAVDGRRWSSTTDRPARSPLSIVHLVGRRVDHPRRDGDPEDGGCEGDERETGHEEDVD